MRFHQLGLLGGLSIVCLCSAAMLLAEILRDQKAKKPAAAPETAPGSGYGVVALAVVRDSDIFLVFILFTFAHIHAK